jgi:hypothetical protein
MGINYIGSNLRLEKEIVTGESIILDVAGNISNFTVYRKDDYSIKATVSWNGNNAQVVWIQGRPVADQDVSGKMSIFVDAGNLVIKNNFNLNFEFVIVKEI